MKRCFGVLTAVILLTVPLCAQTGDEDTQNAQSSPMVTNSLQSEAQEDAGAASSAVSAEEQRPAAAQVQVQPQTVTNRTPAPVSSPKRDALDLYYRGRNAEAEGRTAAAAALYSESAAVCRDEIAANPKNIEAHIVMGWALFRQGKYVEAVEISLSALKINSREARAMETIGECYFYLDRYSEALSYFEKYLELQPSGSKAGTAYFFMGEIYRLTGKTEHADIAYTAAVMREPRLPLWWYRLGLLRENAGKKTSAKAAYEQAVKIRPDYKEALEAIKRLS